MPYLIFLNKGYNMTTFSLNKKKKKLIKISFEEEGKKKYLVSTTLLRCQHALIAIIGNVDGTEEEIIKQTYKFLADESQINEFLESISNAKILNELEDQLDYDLKVAICDEVLKQMGELAQGK